MKKLEMGALVMIAIITACLIWAGVALWQTYNYNHIF